jgi:phosphate:Na+ symporter
MSIHLIPVHLLAFAVGSDDGGGLDVGLLIMGLFGGLALFLYGMDKMSDALKAVAGGKLKQVLATLTTNRWTGALTGALVTAVIQSSSVTTVLVVGFISAGLLTLTQSVGVIMGANVGTTITAQIIAFKVTKYALLLIALGFAMIFMGRREKVRQYGAAMMGLGLVFFGMGVMGEAMGPLRSSPAFVDAMTRIEKPALGILAGALFTALVQSSSATTGIAIVLATQGLISLTGGIALVFGANIGTCITAMLASIGKSNEAKRAAVVHVAFNVLGVTLWLPFMEQLGNLVVSISPQMTDLSGQARMAAETPRQIANAHTLFNVTNTLLFLPFATQFARLAQRLVPDQAEGDEDLRARYLDDELLDSPSLALDRVRLEILRLGSRVHDMLEAAFPAVVNGDQDDLNELVEMDDLVDSLHAQIVAYLGRISESSLSKKETEGLMTLMETSNSLENIGDIVETNLVALGRKRIDEQLSISEATQEVLLGFHQTAMRAVDLAVQAVTQDKKKHARKVIGMKGEVQSIRDSAALHQSQRLVAHEPDRLETYALETDIMQSLQRVYYFAKRMARGVVPAIKVDEG